MCFTSLRRDRAVREPVVHALHQQAAEPPGRAQCVLERGYKVSVVIKNKRKEEFDSARVSTDARAGEDGVNAEQIFDGKVGDGFSGTVLPGKKITAQFDFDAPADAKKP